MRLHFQAIYEFVGFMKFTNFIFAFIFYTVPGPESIRRREEYMVASLTADFLPAPGRPIKITPLRFVPNVQHKPEKTWRIVEYYSHIIHLYSYYSIVFIKHRRKSLSKSFLHFMDFITIKCIIVNIKYYQ